MKFLVPKLIVGLPSGHRKIMQYSVILSAQLLPVCVICTVQQQCSKMNLKLTCASTKKLKMHRMATHHALALSNICIYWNHGICGINQVVTLQTCLPTIHSIISSPPEHSILKFHFPAKLA